MIIHCPNCKVELEVPEELAEGQHVRCPDCGTKFAWGCGSVARSEPVKIADRMRSHEDRIIAWIVSHKIVSFAIGLLIAGLAAICIITPGDAVGQTVRPDGTTVCNGGFSILILGGIIYLAIKLTTHSQKPSSASKIQECQPIFWRVFWAVILANVISTLIARLMLPNQGVIIEGERHTDGAIYQRIAPTHNPYSKSFPHNL